MLFITCNTSMLVTFDNQQIWYVRIIAIFAVIYDKRLSFMKLIYKFFSFLVCKIFRFF